jgi:hypothetical protein
LALPDHLPCRARARPPKRFGCRCVASDTRSIGAESRGNKAQLLRVLSNSRRFPRFPFCELLPR